MVRFEVCHVLAHKCNPRIKGAQAWGCKTVYFTSERLGEKNVLSFPSPVAERCRIERGEGMKQGWLERAVRGALASPGSDRHGSAAREAIVKRHPLTKCISTVCSDRS